MKSDTSDTSAYYVLLNKGTFFVDINSAEIETPILGRVPLLSIIDTESLAGGTFGSLLCGAGSKLFVEGRSQYLDWSIVVTGPVIDPHKPIQLQKTLDIFYNKFLFGCGIRLWEERELI